MREYIDRAEAIRRVSAIDTSHPWNDQDDIVAQAVEILKALPDMTYSVEGIKSGEWVVNDAFCGWFVHSVSFEPPLMTLKRLQCIVLDAAASLRYPLITASQRINTCCFLRSTLGIIGGNGMSKQFFPVDISKLSDIIKVWKPRRLPQMQIHMTESLALKTQ